MGKKLEEKSFDERLLSLKRGCYILGVLQLLTLSRNLQDKNITATIISALLIAMLYFIYIYTAQRNPLGPTLEKIYAGLLVVEGVLLCLTIILIPLAIVYFIVSYWIFKEADYFKDQIENGPTDPIQTNTKEIDKTVDELKSEYSDDENNQN